MTDRNKAPVIVWFRLDLRLGDNPALVAAVETGRPVLPVYVLDDEAAGDWAMGGASRWWLHQSLTSLSADLERGLRCFRGRAEECIPRLALDVGADAVYVNRCVEPWQRRADDRVRQALAGDGVAFVTCKDSNLFDPETVLKADGTPYRVFTPYYRKGCLKSDSRPREPVAVPARLEIWRSDAGDAIEALGLMPGIPWYEAMQASWRVGEAGALERLDRFLDSGLPGYADGRNRPDLQHVSRLSPHLHFGEVSPHQIWHSVQALQADSSIERDLDSFLSELGWREFSAYLLWHWPSLPEENLQSKFDEFPWQQDDKLLESWQRGATGYPIVDAGMRELWQTGYMHNRVRMITGSFLVKNLLQDWRHGERWFWDTLCDADLASNSASWQWVAGSGADAAPYFRIFNPVTQGEKFDPDGDYVRRYLPELENLPTGHVHSPWTAPSGALKSVDYPEPVVELKPSRERALNAFRTLSAS